MEPDNWHDVCYGRDELLAKLQEGYKLSAGGLPQFHILLGMTGIGKTRLAQEVYRWLTRERDPHTVDFPEEYWPDCFHDEATKDRVNPAFDDRPRPPFRFSGGGRGTDGGGPSGGSGQVPAEPAVSRADRGAVRCVARELGRLGTESVPRGADSGGDCQAGRDRRPRLGLTSDAGAVRGAARDVVRRRVDSGRRLPVRRSRQGTLRSEAVKVTG